MNSFENKLARYTIKGRYDQLMARDSASPYDSERSSLFYILAGNIELFRKVDYIYNFEEHSINKECLNSKDIDFSSETRKLIALAFNLFNGYNKADVLDIFSSLNQDNFELALNAISIRFGMGGSYLS